MNVELLQKVRDHILEEPRRLAMEVWLEARAEEDGGPSCGTVGCISGWAAVLSGATESPEDRSDLLDLDQSQALQLFHTGHWPDPWRERWSQAEEEGDKAGEAAVLAEYIDYFIKEG